MFANEYGRIVQTEWIKTAEMRRDVVLGEFVIIPNHFHGILHIVGNRKHVDNRKKGDQQVAPTGPKSKSVGAIMAGFKSAVTKRINIVRETPGAPVWQRNYFEHIIRDYTDYKQIAEYILTNPRRWREDKLMSTHPRHSNRRGDLPVALAIPHHFLRYRRGSRVWAIVKYHTNKINCRYHIDKHQTNKNGACEIYNVPL